MARKFSFLALLLFSTVIWGVSYGQTVCNVKGFGGVDQNDIALAREMALGNKPCTLNIMGANICNSATLERVIYAASPGGACLTGPDTADGPSNLGIQRCYRTGRA
jgi:hypothetical protein